MILAQSLNTMQRQAEIQAIYLVHITRTLQHFSRSASQQVSTSADTQTKRLPRRDSKRPRHPLERFASPYEGNVYAAWSIFQGVGGNNSIQFVRSTDHGRTFSNPMKISEGVLGNQFADIAVTSEGTIYITWRQFEGDRAKQDDAVVFVKSTDGGKSFTKPREITTFESFDAADFAGDPEAAKQAHEQAFENADGPESELS
jgi:hypothetical protein